MIRQRSNPRRSAFTLLETILALGIGLVLLGALYWVLSAQIELTQSGRDTLDNGAVVRSVLTRMADDMQATLGPIDKRVVPDYSTGEPETPETDMDMPESETDSATKPMTMPSAMMPADGENNTVVFNVGVEGGEDYLILTIGKAVRPDSSATLGEASGLRRVIYWMAGGDRGGLARYEVKNPLGSGEFHMMPGTVPHPEKAVIAPEVRKIQFEYYDGNGSWKTSWRSADPVGELGNQTGPPSAIRVRISVIKRGAAPLPSGEPRTVEFVHVVALPTGNHFPQGEP